MAMNLICANYIYHLGIPDDHTFTVEDLAEIQRDCKLKRMTQAKAVLLSERRYRELWIDPKDLIDCIYERARLRFGMMGWGCGLALHLSDLPDTQLTVLAINKGVTDSPEFTRFMAFNIAGLNGEELADELHPKEQDVVSLFDGQDN